MFGIVCGAIIIGALLSYYALAYGTGAFLDRAGTLLERRKRRV